MNIIVYPNIRKCLRFFLLLGSLSATAGIVEVYALVDSRREVGISQQLQLMTYSIQNTRLSTNYALSKVKVEATFTINHNVDCRFAQQLCAYAYLRSAIFSLGELSLRLERNLFYNMASGGGRKENAFTFKPNVRSSTNVHVYLYRISKKSAGRTNRQIYTFEQEYYTISTFESCKLKDETTIIHAYASLQNTK
uniref:Uncharacterized protein n=1 Tax=Glossina austeni TaxID=7395 RepID=A0A1A9VHR4_GLOAU